MYFCKYVYIAKEVVLLFSIRTCFFFFLQGLCALVFATATNT